MTTLSSISLRICLRRTRSTLDSGWLFRGRSKHRGKTSLPTKQCNHSLSPTKKRQLTILLVSRFLVSLRIPVVPQHSWLLMTPMSEGSTVWTCRFSVSLRAANRLVFCTELCTYRSVHARLVRVRSSSSIAVCRVPIQLVDWLVG